ncbi:MAG: TPM domain-containing protein [Deferrisomatales bacterium]
MAHPGARPAGLLTAREKERIEQAIARAEGTTSGEIRVVLSRRIHGDPLEAARRTFARLKMHETRERNGVLILLGVKSRRFAIFGDEGIHRIVGQEGWDHIRDGMAERFRKGDFAGGLEYAVEEVAQVLAHHFPWKEGDVNELSDEVLEE